MGYTHYWSRPAVIPESIFRAIRCDFQRLILPLSDVGVPLAGADGSGLPEIGEDVISLNGVSDCGHPSNEDLVIPYPEGEAHGIGPGETAISGDYFQVGVLLRHRACGGDCSYETFRLERLVNISRGANPDDSGLYRECVKTGFRPYDIAVTAALLIAKRYLRDQFSVLSNGSQAQWSDARGLCQRVLGYGEWFGIVEEDVVENWPGSTETRNVRLRILTGGLEP